MSFATADPTAPANTQFTWSVVDEDWIDAHTVSRYGSLVEMHTSPLRLSGASEAKFMAAKARRVRRAAKPLPLA